MRLIHECGLYTSLYGNPKGEPHSLSQQWKRWKRAFNLYITGKGVSDDRQKRALLLHATEMDTQEIHFILSADAESTTFEATVKSLMIILSQRQTFQRG